MAWFESDVVHDAGSARALADELAATADELAARVERLEATATTALAGWNGTTADDFDRARRTAQRMAGDLVADLRSIAAAALDRLEEARADQARRERLREQARRHPVGVR